jgi:hypothetical protein
MTTHQTMAEIVVFGQQMLVRKNEKRLGCPTFNRPVEDITVRLGI